MKFKKGDIVEVTSLDCRRIGFKVGGQYLVEACDPFYTIVSNNVKKEIRMRSYRFKLVKEKSMAVEKRLIPGNKIRFQLIGSTKWFEGVIEIEHDILYLGQSILAGSKPSNPIFGYSYHWSFGDARTIGGMLYKYGPDGVTDQKFTTIKLMKGMAKVKKIQEPYKKVYRQRKDSIKSKKGTIWTEEFAGEEAYHTKDMDGTLNRTHVENTKFFEEVFQVSPEYATEAQIKARGLKKVK